MIEIKPPFCLVAIFSPIIRVLIIKIVSVVSFRNPTQSVGISQKGGGGQRMTLLLHITEKYKRWWLQILIDRSASSQLWKLRQVILPLSLGFPDNKPRISRHSFPALKGYECVRVTEQWAAWFLADGGMESMSPLTSLASFACDQGLLCVVFVSTFLGCYISLVTSLDLARK